MKTDARAKGSKGENFFTLFVLLIIIIVVSITDRICMNWLSVLILELVIVCGAAEEIKIKSLE